MTLRPTFAFILATVTLDAMGIGLILPVMPDLIGLVRGITLSDAAVWGGILSASYAIMQFLCAPALGRLSDAYGRRPILLVSLAVMAVDYAVMSQANSIWILLVGRIIAGMAAATHATALAYMADLSPPEKRAANFGLISAGFGLGFILGPILGGLLGGLDPRAPFYAAALLAAANFAFGFFAAPETLTRDNRRAFTLPDINPLAAFRDMARLQGIAPLLAVMLAYQVSNFVYPAIWAYYTQAAFGWSTGMVGLSLATYGVAIAITQGALIRPILRALGEARAVIFGLGLNILALWAYAAAPQGWVIWALIPISSLGAIVAPAMQALMSRAAGAQNQGALQGVLASIGALSMVISPLVMTQAFFWATRAQGAIFLPGAPFLLASVLMALALGLFWASLRRRLPLAP